MIEINLFSEPGMVKIFIDFDGTITRKDVGDELFEYFGGTACKSLVNDYYQGKISAVECFRLEANACGKINLREFDEFILKHEIDPSFKEFLEFCKTQEIECYIVSDGLDYYIAKILDRYGIAIPFFSNHLELIQSDEKEYVYMNLSFPHTDEECDRCACCKRNIMLERCSDEDLIVYIGEGYSDFCPVRYADIILAKEELQRYCQKEKIPHVGYNSFDDVLQYFKKMKKLQSSRKIFGLKKRRQAQLARRDLFIGG